MYFWLNFLYIKISKNIFDKLSDTDLYDLIDYLSDTLVKVKNSYQKELTFEVQMIQMIDKIFNKESNVSRETLINETKTENINVPRETLKIENKTDSVIEELKNVRINNILRNATKQNITFIKDLWSNINEYAILYLFDNLVFAIADMMRERKISYDKALDNIGSHYYIQYNIMIENCLKKYKLIEKLISSID